MTWVRIDAPNWARMGRPCFCVELDSRGVITQCAPVVRVFRGQSWSALERWLNRVAGPYTAQLVGGSP